jgi:hypothetical protein
MKDVRKILDAEEPDYAALALLGPDSLPHLQKLATGDDVMLASKATYAASLLDDGAGHHVVLAAAESDEVLLRVAAAGSVKNLPTDQASAILMDLIQDDDAGVRKLARTSVPDDAPEALLARSAQESDPDEGAGREQTFDTLNQLGAMMPGERQGGGGRMPGEQGDERGASSGSAEPGLMPGEKPGPTGPGPDEGRMPG